MLGNRFTAQARRALYEARLVAREFKERFIAPEHLLIGLLHVNAPGVVAVLQHFELIADTIEADMRALLHPAERPGVNLGEMTPACQRVMELAYNEALRLEDDFVSAAHLLLGILAERENTAAHLLRARGMRLSVTQQIIANVEKGQSLLRSAHPEEIAPEHLLRPPASHPDAIPEELLRGSECDQGPRIKDTKPENLSE